MAVTLSLFAGAGAQFFDNNGNVLSGGKIYTYQAGTTTPLAVYTSNAESAFHTNPIILDSAGRVPSGGEIWLQFGVGYKFVLKTSAEVLIATYDNIPSSAQPPAANDADSIMYEQGYTVTAGSFVVGKIYRIASVGTTDFTLIGATNNTVGTHFIATGVGAGTGTAELSQTVETKLRETVSVKDFGAVGDGVTDDTAAIQAALDSGAATVHLLAGTYLVSGQLDIPLDTSLVGEGRQVTFITAAGNTTGTFSDNAVVFKGGTAPTAMPNLASNVIKAQRTITFASAHGLSVGDVFLIYNPTDGSFNSSRPSYRSGEYCTVSDVISSTEVGLENGLYDSYLATAVNLYRCNAYCTGELRGFTAIAPGPGANGIVRAIAVDFGIKLELDDLGARNSDNASFSISKCYKVTGRSLDCFQWSQAPGFGTQYGLSIGNSQELDLTGTFVGLRHGIAYGGGNDFSIPCRAGNVHDFVAKNSTGDIASADWHGNCEFCVYENGFIYGGGLNIAGNNNRITGIKAIGDGMMLILGREILGCDHVVENVECYTGRNDTARGIINIGGNEAPMDATNTRFGGQYIFRNITIKAINATGSPGITVRNRGFVGEQWDVIADNIVYNAPANTGLTIAAVTVSTVSGDPPYRLQATNITVGDTIPLKARIGGSDAAVLVKQDSLTGQTSVTTSTSVTFVESSVTFVKAFAKTPMVMVNNDNTTTNGTDVCVSIARDISNTDFTARYLRADIAATNFAAVQTRNIQWNASLCEW